MSSSDDKLPAEKAQLAAIEESDPQALIGDVVDNRYRVLEFIGQGGMGNVYRAEHVTIRRPVALKLLHPSLAQLDSIRKRFEREAFAIGRIDHPNCVNVSDFGKLDDGSLYLVMEFLEGESLGDLLDRERRMPTARALHIMRHVLRGLGHAHRAGIVHRDVKPENVVLVEQDGDPDFAKILDFGIAKLIDGAEETDAGDKLTQAGVAFGTPIYLSPEQAIGEPADPRSDLYSAAVMLFEMISGRPPFYSEDKLEILAMHTTKPPPTIAEVFPGLPVPDGVESLIQRGLAKRQADRHADADAFIAAIDEVLPPHSAETPAPVLRPRSETGATTDVPIIEARHSSVGVSTPPPQQSGQYTPIPPGATPLQHTTTPIPAQFGQNMETPKSRLPYLLAFAAMIGVAVFLYKYTSRDSENADALSKGTPGSAEENVREAEEELAGGDSAESIVKLLSQEGIESNADGQLQLGHAYSARSEYEPAVTAYTLAVDLDPKLGANEQMQANLRLMTDDDGPVFPSAAGLLVKYGNDVGSIALLLELASGKEPDYRHKAFSILEELHLGDQIDRTRSFSLDLRQGKSCEERREAVAKLRALGDRAAIKSLQAAVAGKKRNRGNKCLVQAAEDAVKYLQTLPESSTPVPD